MDKEIIDIFLIGNKPIKNYEHDDYLKYINSNKDNIIMRVNRMMSIKIGLTGSNTDMLFCDQFAFNWDNEFVKHVIEANPNMHMVIPYHSKNAYTKKFGYSFEDNKSNIYPNIKIDVIGVDSESYYKDYIIDSMPQIELTYGNYWPTNVSYALQFLLNNYIYKTENKVNRKDNAIYRINLMGIDAHNRAEKYKDAPANNPIVHQAFSRFECMWVERLEKEGIIRIFD